MKKFANKYMKWGLTALVVLILAICFVCLIFEGQNIWSGFSVIIRVTMPVIDGLIIAFIATPVLNWIEEKLIFPVCRKCNIDIKKMKNKKRIRAVSVLSTFIFIGLIIYGFFAIVIPQLITSIQNIITRFPTYINNLIELTERLLADNPEVEAYIEGMLDTYSKDLDAFLDNNVLPTVNNLIRSASVGMIGVLKSLYNLVIGLIISLYILSGKEKFASQAKKLCYALFERQTANQIIRAFRFTNKTFIGFLGGKIVDSAIIGVLCFIGTSVLKMPYPVLISVIVGVTNIIPFFGPYIGAIPSALLILVTEPKKCIPFIIFILVLQQLDGNVIGPKILGESTGLSGFWVIFSITLFGGLWGIAGMVVGVPLFAVIYAGINYKVNKFLKKKDLSTNTGDYEKLKYINTEKEYILLEEADDPDHENDQNMEAAIESGESAEADETK
ncbi:MAG: AI-2E family transporter [Lachnospiraceae bacterium]|nr:AI-2E family transporter [Lachnospiraceae bacterium]